jgi:hypothetical protein
MVYWYEIDRTTIDWAQFGKEEGRWKYKLNQSDSSNHSPLRFQVPRGKCVWGVSAYKSLQVEISDPKFIQWWKDLESQICPQGPFNSNLKLDRDGSSSLRLKIDDASYIFDKDSKQVTPVIEEGLFKGQDLSCLIDIESNYFFRDSWGLTVRAFQVKSYGGGEQPKPVETPLKKGICAFLD